MDRVAIDAPHAVDIVVHRTDPLGLSAHLHVCLHLDLLRANVDQNGQFLHQKVRKILTLLKQIVAADHVDISLVRLDHLWPHCPPEIAILCLKLCLLTDCVSHVRNRRLQTSSQLLDCPHLGFRHPISVVSRLLLLIICICCR